tara:strand:+ start:1269 stop:1679 length:411 start_codon:yes stop_codon:yes gene_type:complete
MEEKSVRLLVREVISEIAMAMGGSGWDSNNDIQSFHGYPSGYGQFPYLYTDIPEMLPGAEEINKNSEHIRIKKYENNNEVYDFPLDNFKKGFEIEKLELEKQKQLLNVFDLAKKVIDNLKKDKNFYQNENAGDTSQ